LKPVLALEGVRSLGAAQADSSLVARTRYVTNVDLYRIPRLRGTAALQGQERLLKPVLALEGVRSLGAAQADSSLVARTRYVSNVGSLLDSTAARDRSPDRSPPRSGTTIKALFLVWRASGLSAPRKPIVALLPGQGTWPALGLYWIPRLRGTAALQGQERLLKPCSCSGGRPVPRRRASR
jgi:hypothetical protein